MLRALLLGMSTAVNICSQVDSADKKVIGKVIGGVL